MALTLDYINLIVHSDASITDMVSFHGDLRDVEASLFGILYPVIHSYKQLPIGGGAFIPGIIFLNGWSLEFPAGNFEVKGGQIDVTINPVDDCYVKVTQAGAYAVTSIGSTGLTPADISAVTDAVWERIIEGGYSAEEMLKISGAVLAGKVSGAGTGTEVFKGVDGVTDRITSTVDDDGNRTEVVINVS